MNYDLPPFSSMFGCSVRTAALAVAVMVACMAIGAALSQMTMLTSSDSRLKAQVAIMQGRIEKQAGLQENSNVPLEAELVRLREWLLVKQPALEKQLEESKAALEASEARVVERDATVARLKGEVNKLGEESDDCGEDPEESQLKAKAFQQALDDGRTLLPMNVGCYTKKTKVDCCKSIDAR